MAALLVAGCTHAGDDEPPRALVVERGEVAARYVAGDRLGPTPLGGAVATTLIGNLAPAAAPAPTGTRVAYNSWRGDRPVIRLRNGRDIVLAEGAHSPAWRRDGAIAYFQALRPALPRLEAVRDYVGHVVVRRTPESRPVRWSPEAGRYVVAAWAGERLLAYRITSGWPDLLALDDPGRRRVLARGSGLVAVSEDGARAVVTEYGAEPPLVRILDVASGRELARREVPEVRWLVEAGSWRAGRVAASTSHGVAILGVGGGELVLEQLLRLDRHGFGTGVYEPQLAASGERVTTWGVLEAQPRQAFASAAVVECDLEERRCVRGPDVSSALGPRLVYDPSRP